MALLNVYMNGYFVGEFIKEKTGAHAFQYAPNCLIENGSRPISLSMPLRSKKYTDPLVFNFFNNLLPDHIEIRNKIVARHNAVSPQPFDLLEKIGQDSVGALQFIKAGVTPSNNKNYWIKTVIR